MVLFCDHKEEHGEIILGNYRGNLVGIQYIIQLSFEISEITRLDLVLLFWGIFQFQLKINNISESNDLQFFHMIT